MFSSDEKAVRLATLRLQGPKRNTNAQRLCCVCGLFHRPGGCVNHTHFAQKIVDLHNGLSDLKREVRNLKKRLGKKGTA